MLSENEARMLKIVCSRTFHGALHAGSVHTYAGWIGTLAAGGLVRFFVMEDTGARLVAWDQAEPAALMGAEVHWEATEKGRVLNRMLHDD